MKLKFPEPFQHLHPPVRDVNEVLEERTSTGQRIADRVAAVMGSWTFIICQTLFFLAWATLNVVAWFHHWDPYPFILMNLVLSVQAAYAAPVIMMSQNRQAERDRLEARNDYEINKKSEIEIRAVLDHNAAQDAALATIHEILLGIEAKLNNPPTKRTTE